MSKDATVVDAIRLKTIGAYESKSDLNNPREHKSWADECEGEEDMESDDDDAGSLVDFIANDEEDNEDDEDEPLQESNERQDDEVQIDHIIYGGKRVRRKHRGMRTSFSPLKSTRE